MAIATDTLTVVEPATEQPLDAVPRAGVEETDAAVARARAAYPGWRAVAPGERSRQLHRLADALERHAEDLALLEARNAGKPIADARAAATIKRVRLELGGKSANVVFGDADLERAAAAAPAAVFGNAGQDCCARSRILVERPAVDRFLEVLEEHVEALRVGDPLDETTQMGPLISADQRDAVASYLGGDAPVAIRGSAPDGPGYWMAPVVLSPVSNDDRAAREEIFGPVACVIPFSDEAEAVALANDTIYGLSGSVWTRDGAKALRVARAVETGVMSINSNTSVRVSTPFGGFKQSGVGRELGPHALEHYSEVKTVYYATEAG